MTPSPDPNKPKAQTSAFSTGAWQDQQKQQQPAAQPATPAATPAQPAATAAQPQQPAQRGRQYYGEAAQPAQPAPTATGISGTSGGTQNASAVAADPNMQAKPQPQSTGSGITGGTGTSNAASVSANANMQQKPAGRTYYGEQPQATGISGTPGGSSNAAAVATNPNMQRQPAQPQAPQAMPQSAQSYYGMPSANQPAPAGDPLAGGGQGWAGKTALAANPEAQAHTMGGLLSATSQAATSANQGGSQPAGPARQEGYAETAQDRESNAHGSAANDAASQLKQQLMSQGMSEQDAHQRASEQWGQQMGQGQATSSPGDYFGGASGGTSQYLKDTGDAQPVQQEMPQPGSKRRQYYGE